MNKKQKVEKTNQQPHVDLGDGVQRFIPQSWYDITVDQYVRLTLTKEFNDITFLAIMLGVEEEDILNSSNPNLDIDTYPHLAWYTGETSEDFFSRMTDENKRFMPKEVVLERDGADITIPIPKDLSMKTYGQKISVEQMLEKNANEPFSIFPDVVAIYLYPDWSGEKFNLGKALEFKDSHIMKMPIYLAYPIGRFFLMKLQDSMHKKLLFWLENMPKKKREQGLKILKSLSTLKT